MSVFSRASLFALGPLVSGACKAAGLPAVGAGLAIVARFLSDRVNDRSLRVVAALAEAAEKAWRTLELALAGESLAAAADTADDRAFREEVRLFLLDAQFGGRAAIDRDLVPRCLAELRAARAAGLLGNGPDTLQPGDLTRFSDPAALVAAEWALADELAAGLRATGYPALAGFLTLRPPGDPNAAPLLAVAVRYHFRRTVEDDPKLFQGLAFAQLERIGKAQEDGAGQLARVAGRVEELHALVASGRLTPAAPTGDLTVAARPTPDLPTNGPVAVSPDGKTAVCGSPYDGKLRVFDLATRKELRRLPGHADWVACVAFAPDGRRFVSGGRDGTVKVWDAATGRLLRTFECKGSVPAAVVADGKSVTMTTADGATRVWAVV